MDEAENVARDGGVGKKCVEGQKSCGGLFRGCVKLRVGLKLSKPTVRAKLVVDLNSDTSKSVVLNFLFTLPL